MMKLLFLAIPVVFVVLGYHSGVPGWGWLWGIGLALLLFNSRTGLPVGNFLSGFVRLVIAWWKPVAYGVRFENIDDSVSQDPLVTLERSGKQYLEAFQQLYGEEQSGKLALLLGEIRRTAEAARRGEPQREPAPFKDYYAILGVPQTATVSDIKRAYRRLAKEWHPDMHRNTQVAEEKFKDINEAWQTLKDPQLRAAYDRVYAAAHN